MCIQRYTKDHAGNLTFAELTGKLNKLGYTPWGCTIMDGNFHFVLLDFYRQHPEYDYYWLIEYDVRFSGNWKTFFSFFHDKDEDFWAAHVEIKEDNPD